MAYTFMLKFSKTGFVFPENLLRVSESESVLLWVRGSLVDTFENQGRKKSEVFYDGWMDGRIDERKDGWIDG